MYEVAYVVVSLDISMFTGVFLKGPDVTDESCWLQHSHECLYMNMVKWTIKHLGDGRYVAYYALGLFKSLSLDQCVY